MRLSSTGREYWNAPSTPIILVRRTPRRASYPGAAFSWLVVLNSGYGSPADWLATSSAVVDPKSMPPTHKAPASTSIDPGRNGGRAALGGFAGVTGFGCVGVCADTPCVVASASTTSTAAVRASQHRLTWPSP